MGKHYVDNKQLYQVLLDYKHDRLEAEKKKAIIDIQDGDSIDFYNNL